MVHDTEKYPVTFPQLLCGATMRIVLPGNPGASMTTGYVHEIVGNDYFPCSFGLSFPCDQTYDFEMGPVRFNGCEHAGDEHGHILLSGDDGTARLPHLIYSKADMRQALADIRQSKLLDVYLGETAAWMDVIEYICRHDSVIQSLPENSPHQPRSFNLYKMAWWS